MIIVNPLEVIVQVLQQHLASIQPCLVQEFLRHIVALPFQQRNVLQLTLVWIGLGLGSEPRPGRASVVPGRFSVDRMENPISNACFL